MPQYEVQIRRKAPVHAWLHVEAGTVDEAMARALGSGVTKLDSLAWVVEPAMNHELEVSRVEDMHGNALVED